MEITSKKKRRAVNEMSFRELGMFVAIILFGLLVQSRNSNFLTLENIDDMLTNTAILAILSVGMMMVMITRGIDLSIGSSLALAGMITTKLMIVYPNISPFAALLMGMAIGIVCGLIIGVLVAWGKVPPIIASMGMMNAYRGLAYIISGGEWVSAHEMTVPFKKMATGKILGINNLVAIAILIYIAAFVFLKYTKTGRRIYAVGSNPEAASISGIKIEKILLLTYVIMGALAGIAGILWVCKYASAQGNTASGYEMSVIASCVLGGVSVSGGSGKISGLIFGVLFFGILSNSLPLLKVSSFWQQTIQALIMLVAIILNVLTKRTMDARNQKRRKI